MTEGYNEVSEKGLSAMKWVLGGSVIAAIIIGFVASATVSSRAASIDDASFKFLPPETQAIAFVDVQALVNAPFIQDVLKNGQPDLPREIDQLKNKAGLDPQRDIEKVTFGRFGEKGGLVIAQGKIDKFKIEQYLKDDGKKSEAYLGQTLFRDDNTAFVFFDNLAVIGSVDAVKKAMDQMQLPAPPSLRSDLVAAIQTIEPDNQVWAVGDLSAKDLNAVGVRGPAPAIDMLKTLKNGTFQLRFDTGLHARATANFADAQSAKDLADLARGAVALFKLQIGKQQAQGGADFARLLDGIDVSNNGTTLTLKIEESGDLLKTLKDMRSLAR